jgi:Xaa-Pro aminopeptidase
LGVHEGPVGISKYNQTVFEPNMIVTNEPGYYETGKYGIRIENILVVKEDK